MKLADAKAEAAADGEVWAELSLVERLNRIDTDEGHILWSRYRAQWTMVLQRTWLCWGLGITASREVWQPNSWHFDASLGPVHLYVSREWPA